MSFFILLIFFKFQDNNTFWGEKMKVGEHIVGVMNVNGSEYISLTDLARYADREEPRIPIQNWMRNKDVILYLGLWESINNSDFKRVEFDTFKNEV